MIDVDDLDLTKDFSFVQRGGARARTSILNRYFRLRFSSFCFFCSVPTTVRGHFFAQPANPRLHRLRRVRRAGVWYVCVFYR